MRCLDTCDPRIYVALSRKRGSGAAGAGIHLEEALVKLIGETVERSAWASYNPTPSRVISSSYESLKRQKHNVVATNFLDVYSENSLRHHEGTMNGFSLTDVIKWVRCESLTMPSKQVLLPGQILSRTIRADERTRGKIFLPGVSTGVAAHIDARKALLRSILECYEADAIMTNWYTMRKSPSVDYRGTMMERIIREIMRVRNPSQVQILYITLPRTPVHTFLSLLVNDLVEAIAMFVSSELLLATDLERHFGTIDPNKIYSLGPNYLYYLRSENKSLIRGLLSDIVDRRRTVKLSELPNLDSGNAGKNLVWLVNQTSKLSNYAVFQDMTNANARRLGMFVTGVIIPELTPIQMPSMPCDKSPALTEYGGVRNIHPHPLS